MICARCSRNRGDSLRDDPKLCRAHLGKFAQSHVGKDLVIDCWRVATHQRARRHGLSLQVDTIERFQVDALAPIKPIVALVPLEVHREPNAVAAGMSSPDWHRTRAAQYQIRAYAHLATAGAPQVSEESGALQPFEPSHSEAAYIVSVTNDLIARLAMRIMEATTAWAS